MEAVVAAADAVASVSVVVLLLFVPILVAVLSCVALF